MSPSDPLMIAIDLGTSGPKIALVSLEGTILSSVTKPVSLIMTEDGGVEQDPDEWWKVIKDGLAEVLKKAPECAERVLSISCTAQWSGTVAVDENGRPLQNAMIW